MSNIIDSIKLSGVTYTIQGSGGGGNPTVELTQAEYDALVTAGTVQADTYYIITDAQAGDLTQYWTSAQTNSAITEATSGKADTTAVTQSITEATSGKVDSNVYTAYTASTDTAIQGKQDTLVSGTNIKTINNESLLGSGNIDIQGGGGGGKAISGGTNISITTGETADTINCTLPFSYEGDNLKTTVSGNSFVNYFHYGQIFGINNTLQGKTGAYGEIEKNTTIIGYSNQSLKMDNSIVIGSSNNLGNSFGINYNNYVFGFSNTVNPVNTQDNIANNNFVIGNDNTINQKSNNFIFGYGIKPSNNDEFSLGKYNNSVSGSSTFGDSGNTLFSVGNGTADNARHNAFEIRQNGDIYITSGGTDIKLQDNLGGGSITVDDMLSSTSTNPVQNKVVKSATDRICKLFGYGTSGQTDMLAWATGATSDVVDDYVQFSKINGKKIIGGRLSPTDDFSLVETSAITTSVTSSSTDAQVPSAKAVNDKLGGLSVVKLTESEYTALVTKDSNTLYVVVPDPSN